MQQPAHAHPLAPRFSAPAAWACTLCTALLAAPAAAQPNDEEDLALAYGGKGYVSIATGSRQPVVRAPAAATVITTQDIEAIGATDISDVLETVPGLHVARFNQGFSPIYVIRGLNLGFNPQVLMLLNGMPMTTAFAGNRGNDGNNIPLENIARIEVIRGPGSALYGADAFAGVINIITKTSTDIDGTLLGLRAGSFKSGDAWVQHGGKWGAVDVAAYLRVGSTEGARNTVAADAQTGLDALLSTHASLAPGPLNNGRDFVDGALDLALDRWRLRVGYKDRRHIGTAAGVASALDPVGDSSSRTMSADLNYDAPRVTEHWAMTLRASAMHYNEFSDLVLFPPGANLGAGAFTDGMIGNPYKWERHERLGATALYSGWADHQLRLGAGLAHDAVYKVRESKNFNPDFSPIGSGSIADITDVSDTVPFLRPHGRVLRYAYAQDEWSVAKDWTLTAGLRHDRYSDFGATTNPRIALVWEAAYDLTAKLMYGSAFRPPSMTELYVINNPVAIGNPDLKPEKIRTVEAALSWQARNGLSLGLNLFHHEATDIIRQVNYVYQNAGSQTGNGLEFEAAWDASPQWRWSGNYSYQHSEDDATGTDAGDAPHHHIYVRSDWRFAADWTLHAQLNWVGERPRMAGDTRAPLRGYSTMDLTLRSARLWKNWGLSASVRNLFDADVREPAAASVPQDYPMPGRSFYVQAEYKF